jgi:hypothetical protein
MKDHLKTIPKHAHGKNYIFRPKGVISEGNTTNSLLMAQEAQEHIIHERHTPGTSSALTNQVEQSTRKRRQVEPSEQQRQQNGALADYQMQRMLLENQNKRRVLLGEEQEKAAQASHASGTSLNLVDKGELDTPKRSQQGLPQSPTPQTWALQDYQMLIMLEEQQKKRRLMMEKAAQATHAPGTSSDPADQIELPRATDASQHHAEFGLGRLPDANDSALATQ